MGEVYAVFCCRACGREFADELPPLWSEEAWPSCCLERAYLVGQLVLSQDKDQQYDQNDDD